MNYEIPWFIYALIVDDEIVYIGRTTQPTARRRQHRWEQRKGCNPELEVMCCSATTADAVATEAMLIAKHAPKFNVAYSPRRRPCGPSLHQSQLVEGWHSGPNRAWLIANPYIEV
jgi:predicted GIY-YIG superfamily endonuclease